MPSWMAEPMHQIAPISGSQRTSSSSLAPGLLPALAYLPLVLIPSPSPVIQLWLRNPITHRKA